MCIKVWSLWRNIRAAAMHFTKAKEKFMHWPKAVDILSPIGLCGKLLITVFLSLIPPFLIHRPLYYILGDFNIHMDNPTKDFTACTQIGLFRHTSTQNTINIKNISSETLTAALALYLLLIWFFNSRLSSFAQHQKSSRSLCYLHEKQDHQPWFIPTLRRLKTQGYNW